MQLRLIFLSTKNLSCKKGIIKQLKADTILISVLASNTHTQKKIENKEGWHEGIGLLFVTARERLKKYKSYLSLKPLTRYKLL